MSKYDPELTEAQTKAIRKLEAALKECGKAKLYIYGMCSSLVCYNGHHLDSVEKTDCGGSIETYGVIPHESIYIPSAYKDSGADDPWRYAEPYETKGSE